MDCYKFKICPKDIDPLQKLRPYTDCGHCKYHVNNICESYFDEKTIQRYGDIRTLKPYCFDTRDCRQPKGIPIFKDGCNSSWGITSTTPLSSTEFTFKINDYPNKCRVMSSYDSILCRVGSSDLRLKLDKKYTNEPKLITHNS